MPRWSGLSLGFALVYAARASGARGTVSGRVTRGDTSSGVDSALFLCTADSSCYTVFTDSLGHYSIDVEPGTYYVYTFNSFGLVDEIYNNIPCLGWCNSTVAVSTGTPVLVASGGNLSGIDFTLNPGGAISGTIVDATSATPLGGIMVSVYAVAGGTLQHLKDANTDASGVYIVDGLLDGAYFA